MDSPHTPPKAPRTQAANQDAPRQMLVAARSPAVPPPAGPPPAVPAASQSPPVPRVRPIPLASAAKMHRAEEKKGETAWLNSTEVTFIVFPPEVQRAPAWVAAHREVHGDAIGVPGADGKMRILVPRGAVEAEAATAEAEIRTYNARTAELTAQVISLRQELHRMQVEREHANSPAS